MPFPLFSNRLIALTGLLLAALAGCGGGADAEVVPAAAASGQLASALAVSGQGESATAGWTLCATEGQTCVFSGTQQVRYGTAAQNVVLTRSGPVECSNAVFGDPVYGTVKSCWFDGTPVAPTTPANDWTTCAGEHGFCAFSGTRAVRYGTDTVYVTATRTDGVACENSVFGDPVVGTLKNCYLEANASAPAPAPTPAPGPTPAVPTSPSASGTNAPVVLNASNSARAGDVVSVQGEGFGSAPTVYLESAPTTALQIVNRVGTGWLAVQLPASATGALHLRVANATGTSARVALNAARPMHLDALQLTPGGAFRVFGRNLLLAGSAPTVTVAGQAATIDLARSDEHMLTVVAPAALSASAAAAVLVDNGNGTGATALDRTIQTLATGSGDPFTLGVGWGSGFGAITANTVDAKTDARLAQKVRCDGISDDSAAIQAAIDLAASNGGGVVKLPTGQCRMAGRMTLRSRVVVQGAGKTATEVVYGADYPIWGAGIDLSGVRNLTLTNAGSAGEGPLLKDSTRVVLQNVRIRLTTSRQMYLSGNRHFAVQGCDIEQTGSISGQGPYVFEDSAGLVFENNTTQWVGGAPAFGRVHDSYLHANRFTRDARGQNLRDSTVHSMTIDFAHRLAIVGNTFDVAYGPITNTTRNDGETILTEGGGPSPTDSLGTVASASARTLSDPSNSLNVDPFATGSIPENHGVAIVGGKGAGQTRRIVAYGQGTLTVDRDWDIVPDATSRYSTSVWGIEKALIKGNILSQNPRGIWLYNTAMRDVAVVDNTISEGGGIYVRAFQNLSMKRFTPIYNVTIARNRIANSTGHWMSYVNAVFVNADARAFGIAMIGVEMRSNEITANRPNVSSTWEEYANGEGFMNMMRVENYGGYESSGMPRVLGTILTDNRCTYCDVGVRIGTGAGGTTILGSQLVESRTLLDDWATTSTSERATDTIVK